MTGLLTHVDGHVHILELNRPNRLNALSVELVDALHLALDVAQRDHARVLVIAARGRSFSAGFDLRQDLASGAEIVQISRMQDLTIRLREIPVPSVCAVHGDVVGGGLELAMACDFVVATPDARLSFPDVRAGFAVGGGATYLLPRMIGLARARMILLTGGQLSGVEAVDAGMIAKTAEFGDLRAEVMALAAQLAALDPDALLRVRSGIDAGLHGTLTQALDRELADMTATLHTTGASATRNFRDHGTYSPT